MRKLPLVGVCGVALLCVAALVSVELRPGQAQEKPKEPPKKENKEKAETPLQTFMRAKLGASNQVLEGLVTEDFDLIRKGAVKLQVLSSAEEWRISEDAIYRQYSAEFRRIAEQLEKRAKDEKLEAAALSWMEATMSCIECHKHVRGMMLAGGISRAAK
jgi:hypothetical protein